MTRPRLRCLFCDRVELTDLMSEVSRARVVHRTPLGKPARLPSPHSSRVSCRTLPPPEVALHIPDELELIEFAIADKVAPHIFINSTSSGPRWRNATETRPLLRHCRHQFDAYWR
jgi:hypothetical protein